jgi:hypothetical protein
MDLLKSSRSSFARAMPSAHCSGLKYRAVVAHSLVAARREDRAAAAASVIGCWRDRWLMSRARALRSVRREGKGHERPQNRTRCALGQGRGGRGGGGV